MAEVHIKEHSGPIKTPQQLLVAVLAALVVTIAGILLLIQLITGGLKVDMDSPAMSEDAIARRLKPVGEVAIGDQPAPPANRPAAAAPAAAAAAPAAAAAAPAANAGEQLYKTVCQACHDQGLAGAPKTGDKAAWNTRIAQGTAMLHQNAIKGIRTMPPRGGAMSAPDADIKAAVDYMIARSK